MNENISDAEVQKALFSMKPWKAPGPNGFAAGFYQISWEVVGQNVINFVRSAWNKPSIVVILIKQIFVSSPRSISRRMLLNSDLYLYVRLYTKL